MHVGVSDCKTDNGENARMHETNTYANVMHMMTWNEMHDMNKMQKKDKTQPRRESHNLKPKMARVRVQIWQVTSGVLQHSTTTRGSRPEI